MKKVLLILLALTLLLGITACDKDKTEEYSSLYGYSTDPLVDRFADDYAKGGAIAMEEVKAIAGGKNITATLDGVALTVYADGDNLHFILESGLTVATRDRMLVVFDSLVAVADADCTQTNRADTIAHLKEQKKLIMNYKVGGNTVVETYAPAMGEGEMASNYRVTFAVRDYGKRLIDAA